MLTLADRGALRRALRDPALDAHLRAVLQLRHDQLGDVGAAFYVAGPDDLPADAEAAVGWPMQIDGAPQWEWLARHPGAVIEAVFILSDDGPAQVLLTADDTPVGRRLLQLEAAPAD